MAVLVWCIYQLSGLHSFQYQAAAGFEFHHTEPNYVLLVRRLQEDALVPGYATITSGRAGGANDEQRQDLVVSERHRARRGPIINCQEARSTQA